jgi:DNA-directed RNA polymerase subunit RPC12/RpoP
MTTRKRQPGEKAVFTCPECSRPLATTDKKNQLRAAADVELIEPLHQAKQLKCPCGHLVVLLKGEVV